MICFLISLQKNPAAVKLLNQPSISITPLPRQSSNNSSLNSSNTAQRQAGVGGGSKTTFVICEICDGYIKVSFMLLSLHSKKNNMD